jgi:hypothetical protein
LARAVRSLLASLPAFVVACSVASAGDSREAFYDGSVPMRDVVRSLGDRGGRVVVRFGDYRDIIVWNGSGLLYVVGELGPAGERPTLHCPKGGNGIILKSQVKASGLDGKVDKYDGPGELVVENLKVTDCFNGAVIVAGHRLRLVNMEFTGLGGHGVQGGTPKPSDPGERILEIVGGFYHHNRSHAIYTGRLDFASVVGLHSCSANTGYHTVKITARRFEVRNSLLETLCDDTAEIELETDAEGKFVEKLLSGTLIDVVACARGVIAGNRLVKRFVRVEERASAAWGSTGPYAIDVRQRQSIEGCDEPDYESAEFWSQEFWRKVAQELPETGALHFRIFIVDNTFEILGANAAETVIVHNLGTYPREKDDDGNGRALPTPDQWVERSRVYLGPNEIVGEYAALHAEGGLRPEGKQGPVTIVVEEPLPDWFPR